jgi:hypothetical protein
MAGTEYSSGNINLYGNSALWNGTSNWSASGQSVSTPVYGYSRIAIGELALFDRVTGHIAWRGQIRVEGQGSANITDGVFIDSATSKIAKELKASRLIE